MSKILPFHSEIYRKIIHLMCLFFPITYFFSQNDRNFKIIICFFAFMAITIDFLRFKNTYIKVAHNYVFGNVVRAYEKNNIYSATYLTITFCIITLLFDKNIAIIAMVITAVSDSIAAIVGMKHGDIYLIHRKTLQGTLSFFFASLIILIFFSVTQSFLLMLFFSFCITLIELITKTEYDNITVPFFASLILFFGT